MYQDRAAKILPNLNIKKAIGNHQDYFEIIRENPERSKTKSYSPKPVLTLKKFEKQKKELKVSQFMPTDRTIKNKLQEAMEEYGSLNVVLKPEPNQTLNNLLAENNTPRRDTERSHHRMASTESLFPKKNHSTDSNSSRQITLNSVPPSNFVFQKKKGSIRETNHQEHIYQYALGTGIATLPDNSLGLNGKKVQVREVMQKQIIRQQKTYLKKLQIDQIASFRSTHKDFEYSPERVKAMVATSRKYLLSPPPDRAVERFKTQVAVSVRRLRHEDYNLRLNTQILDGSYLGKFPQTINIGIDSPGRSKGFC